MNTPAAILEWLAEKFGEHRWATVRERRAVCHRWERQMGGRVMSAALSASIEPSEFFELEVRAPETDEQYIAGAKNAVVSVLLCQGLSPVLSCKVTLFSFQPHQENSSYAAFFEVAKEATEQLLGVGPDCSPNIVW